MTCTGTQVHEGRNGEGAALHTLRQLVLIDGTEWAFLPVFCCCEPLNRHPKTHIVPRKHKVLLPVWLQLKQPALCFSRGSRTRNEYLLISFCVVAVAAQSLVWSVCCVSAPMYPLNISLLICWQQPGQLTPTFLENCLLFYPFFISWDEGFWKIWGYVFC